MNDAEIIKSPLAWPGWPMLPVKRYTGGTLQVGYIRESRVTRVVLENMLLDRGESPEVIDYDSVEDIVKDGWMVD